MNDRSQKELSEQRSFDTRKQTSGGVLPVKAMSLEEVKKLLKREFGENKFITIAIHRLEKSNSFIFYKVSWWWKLFCFRSMTKSGNGCRQSARSNPLGETRASPATDLRRQMTLHSRGQGVPSGQASTRPCSIPMITWVGPWLVLLISMAMWTRRLMLMGIRSEMQAVTPTCLPLTPTSPLKTLRIWQPKQKLPNST